MLTTQKLMTICLNLINNYISYYLNIKLIKRNVRDQSTLRRQECHNNRGLYHNQEILSTLDDLQNGSLF